jgi:rod shape-determining protein MreD
VIWYAALPLTLLVALLQIGAAPSFAFFGVHPDLPVVWLCCWAVIRGRHEAMALIPVAGLALGLAGSEPLGASLLALLPVAGFAALVEASPARGRFLAVIAITAVCSILYTFVHAAAAAAAGEGLGPPLNLLIVAPRAAVLDMLAAALWFWPLRLAVGRRVRPGSFRRI